MGANPKSVKKAKDFIHRLVLMKDECFRLGLYRTARSLDTALCVSGWDLAWTMAGETVTPSKGKKKIRTQNVKKKKEK